MRWFAVDGRGPLDVEVRDGSWSCKNALAEALTPREVGDVTARGHFSAFGGLSVPEAVLIRDPPSWAGLQHQTNTCRRGLGPHRRY
jgi:hypothetical protein